MASALAEGGLDQPAKFTTCDDGTAPNLRRIVVDLHDEYARHVGHADLLREAVNGLVGEDPAAVTGGLGAVRTASRPAAAADGIHRPGRPTGLPACSGWEARRGPAEGPASCAVRE